MSKTKKPYDKSSYQKLSDHNKTLPKPIAPRTVKKEIQVAEPIVEVQLRGYELVDMPAENNIFAEEKPEELYIKPSAGMLKASLEINMPAESITLNARPALPPKQNGVPTPSLTPAQKIWWEKNKKRFGNNPSINSSFT